ncbi:uncharacterized protein LY89DRAFT_636845 [Mollisia scopiformis]|uniref:Uncharacterized protein n=1 Tax=Mollisia scopiformis TaxID=149040 RepID=A0A194XR68_MOLSC|nr:uncharacterized protein LY89DRAFT_636845 [Mollisia scopiformis]KUJ22646.1 hypothetical protein LY89DRAFT_636845 [Mollisia scopiformis]
MMWKRARSPHSISESTRTLLLRPLQSRSDPPIHSKEDLEPTRSRFLLVPGLLITSIINFVLIAGLKGHWTVTGSAATTIINNPSTFSAVRQIIASLLGAVYMYSICMIINWASRVIISKRAVTLDRLDFWSAICGSRVDWTLPKSKVPLVLLFIVATRIPAAFWAGALAPTLTKAEMKKTHNMTTSVPHYTQQSLDTYEPESLFNSSDPMTSTPLGIFSFSPVRDRFGFLLNDGASASSQNRSEVQLYKKNDNSNFTYYGRSYGVGASVGLVDKQIGQRFPGLDSFSFNETGTMTNISCIFNRSTDFHLELVLSSDNIMYPNIYEATGCPPWDPPGGNCGGFSEIGIGNDDTVVAVAWWVWPNATVENFEGTLAIAAGKNYTPLNNSQCSVTMVPNKFTVNVNVKRGLIQVVPLNQSMGNGTNPIPIVQGAFTTTAALSEVASTKFTSAIGNMLNSNIYNVKLQETSESTDGKTLRGISEAMEVVTDDALVAYSSAQLMLANEATQVPITIVVDAVLIGTAPYIYTVAGINAAVLLLVIFEGVRTRGWRGMPRFNYMSVKSTVVSSSMGGNAVARKAEGIHKSSGQSWTGNANDRKNGNIAVRLRRVDGLALTLDGDKYEQRTSQTSDYDMPEWSDRISVRSGLV